MVLRLIKQPRMLDHNRFDRDILVPLEFMGLDPANRINHVHSLDHPAEYAITIRR